LLAAVHRIPQPHFWNLTQKESNKAENLRPRNGLPRPTEAPANCANPPLVNGKELDRKKRRLKKQADDLSEEWVKKYLALKNQETG